MVRIQARWLAFAASALLAAGAPAQAPPAVPADASKGVDVTREVPDPTAGAPDRGDDPLRPSRRRSRLRVGRLRGGARRPPDRLLPEPLRPDRGLDLPHSPPPRYERPDALLPRAGNRDLPLLDRHRRRIGAPRAEVPGRQAARHSRRERLRLRRHRPRPGRLPGDHLPPGGHRRRPARARRPRRPPLGPDGLGPGRGCRHPSSSRRRSSRERSASRRSPPCPTVTGSSCPTSSRSSPRSRRRRSSASPPTTSGTASSRTSGSGARSIRTDRGSPSGRSTS